VDGRGGDEQQMKCRFQGAELTRRESGENEEDGERVE